MTAYRPVVQQLCKSCRTCFMFYCMFYFTCGRSYTRILRVCVPYRRRHGRIISASNRDSERKQVTCPALWSAQPNITGTTPPVPGRILYNSLIVFLATAWSTPHAFVDRVSPPCISISNRANPAYHVPGCIRSLFSCFKKYFTVFLPSVV